MNDAGSVSSKGWAVLGEFLRKVPVVDVFLTIGHFAVRPLKFTDEVLREDWTNKAKPPWFLIQTVLLGYAFRLVTPWRFIDEQASSYTDAQKHFELATELASGMLAFFAAAFVVHLILGRSRIPFVSAFFVFCYINGFGLVVEHLFIAVSWLVTGERMSRTVLGWSIIVELLFFLGSLYYLFAPIIHIYHPRWYRMLGAAFAGLVTLFVIMIGLSYISDMIIARFPPK